MTEPELITWITGRPDAARQVRAQALRHLIVDENDNIWVDGIGSGYGCVGSLHVTNPHPHPYEPSTGTGSHRAQETP